MPGCLWCISFPNTLSNRLHFTGRELEHKDPHPGTTKQLNPHLKLMGIQARKCQEAKGSRLGPQGECGALSRVQFQLWT